MRPEDSPDRSIEVLGYLMSCFIPVNVWKRRLLECFQPSFCFAESWTPLKGILACHGRGARRQTLRRSANRVIRARCRRFPLTLQAAHSLGMQDTTVARMLRLMLRCSFCSGREGRIDRNGNWVGAPKSTSAWLFQSRSCLQKAPGNTNRNPKR